jgi:RimJ/RimL family protein N-acetyltransferase
MGMRVGSDGRDQPLRLEGANVILRPIRPDEQDIVARAMAKMEPEVLPNGPPSSDRLRARIANSGRFVEGAIEIGIETDGRLIGSVQTYVPEARALPANTYEIGIGLNEPGDRGKGLGTEALALFIEWLRGIGAVRVQAGTAPGNIGMRRCLAKLGFRPEDDVVEDGGFQWTIFVLELV